MQASPTDIQRALKGADYPASSEDLVELAEQNGADEDVLDDLRTLEEREYDNPADVMSGLDSDE